MQVLASRSKQIESVRKVPSVKGGCGGLGCTRHRSARPGSRRLGNRLAEPGLPGRGAGIVTCQPRGPGRVDSRHVPELLPRLQARPRPPRGGGEAAAGELSVPRPRTGPGTSGVPTAGCQEFLAGNPVCWVRFNL